MNQIIFKINPDDNFSMPDVTSTINLNDKEQYHYTFYESFPRLYQFPVMFSNTALDLFYISLMVYYADRKIERRFTNDAWTRHFKVYIPVLDLDKWQENKVLLEKMISFLSGDNWTFEFRKRDKNLNELKIEKGIEKSKVKFNPDIFCMLSGGLDSFIGAIDLLSSNKKVAFIGHYGGGKGVKLYQDFVNKQLLERYNLDERQFFNFYAAPIRGKEDSTRTRSFMFFSHAIILASGVNRDTDLIIPENGLISLNIPLTNSRLGSSSTRTTHPYYIELLQQIITNLELKITLKNPYQYKTKGEMIMNCKDQVFLKNNIDNTMSCSHPDQGRYLKEKKPCHCGFCLPCIIRRASIEKAYKIDSSSYRNPDFKIGNKSRIELNSFKVGLLEYKKRKSNAFIIQNAGPILNNIDEFCALYERGMNELKSFLDKYD